MIRGVWHSITYNDEVADVESFIDERGFAFLFDRKDWWIHDGHPVYAGQHVQAGTDDRVEAMCREMRDLSQNMDEGRSMEILLDALH